MIGHFNLLDKIYYVDDIQAKKVTAVSKPYNNFDNTKKLVDIVLDNDTISVDIHELCYTLKEALEIILNRINYRISYKEGRLKIVEKDLKELYNLQHTAQDQLDNETY